MSNYLRNDSHKTTDNDVSGRHEEKPTKNHCWLVFFVQQETSGKIKTLAEKISPSAYPMDKLGSNFFN